MARILAEAGVEYAALDDSHFLCSGLRPEDLYGYYMTEEEGEAIKVFPIQEKLRYLVPFHPVEETISYLRDLATEGGERSVVLHDDGEKFGVWPGTYKSVFEDGWLEEFFTALTENQDWIHCVTYSQYMDDHPPLGRTYITCASYQEMMAWALPTERQRELRAARDALAHQPELEAQCGPFLRGGFWRNFLAKYPESNTMQKRMLQVSKRLERLREHAGTPAYEEARQYLHRGQCNCAYWHGQFGGLYLNHLRTAIFEQLIRADIALDTLDATHTPLRLEAVDFDGDGQDELLMSNDTLGIIVSPHDGGTVVELDYKPGAFNLINTLARREEPYHDNLPEQAPENSAGDEGAHSIHEPFQAKEAGLHALLFQDHWRRASLRDHFLAMDTEVDDLYRNQAHELADLPRSTYVGSLTKHGILLTTEVPLENGAGAILQVRKEISFTSDDSGLEITYDISCNSAAPFSGLFCPEFGINFLTESAPDRYFHSDDQDLERPMLNSHGRLETVGHLALRDEWQNLESGFRLEQGNGFFFFPLETISQSECGQERVHQGSMVYPCWALTLSGGETVSRKLTWYVRRLNAVHE